MRGILLIFIVFYYIVSCSSSISKIVCSNEDLVTEVPEEAPNPDVFIGKYHDSEDDCAYYQSVKYNPILENLCTNDYQLHVFFTIHIDTIINDTIVPERIVVDAIRGHDGSEVESRSCEEYFLSQLYKKTYIYNCKSKRVRLKCRTMVKEG